MLKNSLPSEILALSGESRCGKTKFLEGDGLKSLREN
jgi:hypothetical protein